MDVLETEQSEIRFITTSIFPEVEKISYNLKHDSCVLISIIKSI